MLANIRKKNPAKRILVRQTILSGLQSGLLFKVRRQDCLRHGADNLATFLSILLDEHDMPPGRCTEMPGVVVGIARPNETVIRHMVPFFARDFAGFATNAHSRIGEEPNLHVVAHVRMPTLIRTVCAFANHGSVGVVE
jgi:hypothetical protein